MSKVCFYTLGCRLNQAETALISDSFRHRGYDVVAFGQAADVCVINSCTVTEHADADCRKLVRQILRQNPHTYIAVIGCYAQVAWQNLQDIAGIDLIVGTQDKARVVDLIAYPMKQKKTRVVRSRISTQPFTIDTFIAQRLATRANLKIQDGCDCMCSYCLIPFARGRARSRDFEDIRREALQLTQSGFKEIVLTGVNIGAYRFNDKLFLHVVDMLLQIPQIMRLRISSIEPTALPPELFSMMLDSRLCHHLHVPLQSGCNQILAKMNRKYTVTQFRNCLDLAVSKVPDILLATDIIVGFPGEDDRAFEESCSVLQESPMAYAHVFSFSSRAGTAASRLGDRVDPRVKKRRSRHLHELSNFKRQQFYRRFIGQKLTILTEQRDQRNRWIGFSNNYIKVAIENPTLTTNHMVEVTIIAVEDEVAIGEI